MKKLKLTQLSKSFGDEKVLSNISIHVNEGEFVTILGPSGCGKSTLFHIIGGIEKPTQGTVEIDELDVTGKKGLISFMPQNHSLFPWRTVEQNVMLAQEVAGVSSKKAKEEAREWIERIGLIGYERCYPHVLSGGMQQRVSFLRALLSPKELMCLDEPFGSLDALTRMEMQQWLLNIWEQNRRSVLFVTHSIEEAILLSDRIYLLSNKPTTVIDEIIVPFQRPRDGSIIHDQSFQQLKQNIYLKITGD